MTDHKFGTREEWPLHVRPELRRFTSFMREGDVIYHTYSTTGRGVEFLMGFYAILDHAPKGRDEGEAWQTWIRRHDEYGA